MRGVGDQTLALTVHQEIEFLFTCIGQPYLSLYLAHGVVSFLLITPLQERLEAQVACLHASMVASRPMRQPTGTSIGIPHHLFLPTAVLCSLQFVPEIVSSCGENVYDKTLRWDVSVNFS
jgi:hypothetical protein